MDVFLCRREYSLTESASIFIMMENRLISEEKNTQHQRHYGITLTN